MIKEEKRKGDIGGDPHHAHQNLGPVQDHVPGLGRRTEEIDTGGEGGIAVVPGLQVMNTGKFGGQEKICTIIQKNIIELLIHVQ